MGEVESPPGLLFRLHKHASASDMPGILPAGPVKGAKNGAVGGMTGSGCPSTFLSQFGADARRRGGLVMCRVEFAGEEQARAFSALCYSESYAKVSA